MASRLFFLTSLRQLPRSLPANIANIATNAATGATSVNANTSLPSSSLSVPITANATGATSTNTSFSSSSSSTSSSSFKWARGTTTSTLSSSPRPPHSSLRSSSAPRRIDNNNLWTLHNSTLYQSQPSSSSSTTTTTTTTTTTATTSSSASSSSQQLPPPPHHHHHHHHHPPNHSSQLLHKRLTGAGVVVFDPFSQTVALFENVHKQCFEEPGGFIKSHQDPATAASMELFEESCTTIREDHAQFLPDFVDVTGRSSHSAYRGFFMLLPHPFSVTDYLKKRMQLEASGYPREYLETRQVAFVPLQEIADVLEKKTIDYQDHSAPVTVTDTLGRETQVSKRTMKIFQEGGLRILQKFASSNSDWDLPRPSNGDHI